MGYFGKILKATALMFVIGGLLGLAAPALAGFLGFAPGFVEIVTTNPAFGALWTAGFFGAFGGIRAALEPVFDHIFPDKKYVTEPSRSAPTVGLNLPGMGHASSMDKLTEMADSKFQDMVGGRRATDMSFQDKMAAAQAQPHEQSL
jgi:hypothetical protein